MDIIYKCDYFFKARLSDVMLCYRVLHYWSMWCHVESILKHVQVPNDIGVICGALTRAGYLVKRHKRVMTNKSQAEHLSKAFVARASIGYWFNTVLIFPKKCFNTNF